MIPSLFRDWQLDSYLLIVLGLLMSLLNLWCFCLLIAFLLFGNFFVSETRPLMERNMEPDFRGVDYVNDLTSHERAPPHEKFRQFVEWDLEHLYKQTSQKKVREF